MKKLNWVNITANILGMLSAVFLVASGWKITAQYGLGWHVRFGDAMWATVGMFTIHWGWVTWKRIVL